MTWLTHADPNIRGLRRVDESTHGHRLAMIHIAIPLEYRRAQLALALGIDQLADDKKTPRVNLIASAAWNEPHSYIRVQADFIVSRVLGAIKERIMRPIEASGHTIQIPLAHAQTLARSRPEERDENSRLRSSVTRAMALRNASIEPHQIQILTHRVTGEKWVRIIDVDRSRRTTLRLAIKRSGISNSVEYQDEVKGSDWSIRFAAAEAPKLFPRSPASFDVHAETPDHRREPGEGRQPSRKPGKLADGPPNFSRRDSGLTNSPRHSVSAQHDVVGPEDPRRQTNATLALKFA